jgi:hypothetical protein
MELVPLKVRIGLKTGGGHQFPDFNQIDPGLRDNMDWSYYVDKFGGWHYDKIAGHADDDTANDSPPGTWIGMLLVPETFAMAAVAQFPDTCSIIIETDAEKFYDERAHIHEPEIKEDKEVLQAIQAKRALNIAEDQGDLDALNPDHPAPGRRRNKFNTFNDFKTQKGITIKVQ